MSSKMNQIPFLSSYEDVRAEMNRDLQSGMSVPLPVLLGEAEPDVWGQ